MDKISEEQEEDLIEMKKYKFLGEAVGYSIEDLKQEKDDSFFKSTKAQKTIINYLGIFKGVFNSKNLEVHYYEALFVLEQDYNDLKKTLMINEVIIMILTMIENRMFPSDMFMPNLYDIMFRGVLDILAGKINII